MRPIIKGAFLELVKGGIWAVKPDLTFFNLLTAEDWEAVYSLVQRQSLIGVCFSAVELLPMALRPPQALYLKWFGQVLYIKAGSCRMREAVLEWVAKFEAMDIHPVVMKGLGVACWYPIPVLRMTGDIDLYFPERYNEAVSAVEAEGFRMTYMPDHDKFQYKGIWVEMHHRLIRFPLSADWELGTTVVSDALATYRIPDVDTNALLLISHAAKHLIGPGVGMRHLCDWAVFLQYNYQAIHFNKLWRELKLMGLERFAIEFTALAHDCLEMDFPKVEYWYGDSDYTLEKRLLDDIMDKGDCGKVTMEQRRKGNWFTYYAGLTARLLKVHVYCPGYVRRVIGQRLYTRIGFVLRGEPFGNSLAYKKKPK